MFAVFISYICISVLCDVVYNNFQFPDALFSSRPILPSTNHNSSPCCNFKPTKLREHWESHWHQTFLVFWRSCLMENDILKRFTCAADLDTDSCSQVWRHCWISVCLGGILCIRLYALEKFCRIQSFQTKFLNKQKHTKMWYDGVFSSGALSN